MSSSRASFWFNCSALLCEQVSLLRFSRVLIPYRPWLRNFTEAFRFCCQSPGKSIFSSIPPTAVKYSYPAAKSQRSQDIKVFSQKKWDTALCCSDFMVDLKCHSRAGIVPLFLNIKWRDVSLSLGNGGQSLFASNFTYQTHIKSKKFGFGPSLNCWVLPKGHSLHVGLFFICFSTFDDTAKTKFELKDNCRYPYVLSWPCEL